jgi:hypothetical protein
MIFPGRGGFQQRDFGPPDTVLEMGKFMHACEGEIVCESINTKIPYFNAPIYLENKVRKLQRVICEKLESLTYGRHPLVKLTKFLDL